LLVGLQVKEYDSTSYDIMVVVFSRDIAVQDLGTAFQDDAVGNFKAEFRNDHSGYQERPLEEFLYADAGPRDVFSLQVHLLVG